MRAALGAKFEFVNIIYLCREREREREVKLIRGYRVGIRAFKDGADADARIGTELS